MFKKILLLVSIFLININAISILQHNTYWLFQNTSELNNLVLESINKSPYYIEYNKKIELLSKKYSQYNPDIIGLIEIDGINSLNNINKYLNNSYQTISTDNLGQNVGLMVKYPYKIIESTQISGKNFKKGLHVVIQDNSINYNVIIIHPISQFENNNNNKIRDKQFKEIYDYIDKNKLKSLIIFGDFNEPDLDYLTKEESVKLKKFKLHNIKDIKKRYKLTSLYKYVVDKNNLYSVFFDESVEDLKNPFNIPFYFESNNELSNIDNMLISNNFVFNKVLLDNPLEYGQYVTDEWYSDHRIIYSDIIQKNYTEYINKINDIIGNSLDYVIDAIPYNCDLFLIGGTTRTVISSFNYSKDELLKDLDLKTNCKLKYISKYLKKNNIEHKISKYLIQINNIQIAQIVDDYYADFYMNAIKYDLMTDKLIDTHNLGIYSAKNKILIPFNIQKMNFKQWFNNFKRIRPMYSVIKFLIRYNRFYECGYRSDMSILKEVKRQITYYIENHRDEFYNIYNKYNYTLNFQSKECKNLTIL